MKNFAKRILALSVCSALLSTTAHAISYEVIDKGADDTHKFTFPVQENNSGETVISATEPYNLTVQYQQLTDTDFDLIIALATLSHELTPNYTEIENEITLRAGNPTDNDAFWALTYVSSQVDNFAFQQYNSPTALLNINDNVEELVVFDTDLEGNETNDSTELSRSTSDIVNGITDNGWIYGGASAPYLPVEFEVLNDQGTEDLSDDETTTVTEYLREFAVRGFYSVDKGQTFISLLAPETTGGGFSNIVDMSENGFAIGVASESLSLTATESLELVATLDEDPIDCTSSSVLGDSNLIKCVNDAIGTVLSEATLYSFNTYMWTISNGGELVETEVLDSLLVTPHEDDERDYSNTNTANAVNDLGTVVGTALNWFDQDVTSPDEDEFFLTYATVFKNGQAYEIETDHDTYPVSTATDINNNDIAIGNLTQTIDGVSRSIFYYANVSNVDNIEVVLPEVFFTGSSTIPKSINDNGFIVGSAEVESGITTRRTGGFIYDINADTFINLNDYIDDCDTPYTIIDASHINNNNDISATALITVNARDFVGTELFEDNGVPTEEEVVRAVTLRFNPEGVSGECTVEEDEIIERQGASFGVFMPLVLLILGIRRRFK